MRRRKRKDEEKEEGGGGSAEERRESKSRREDIMLVFRHRSRRCFFGCCSRRVFERRPLSHSPRSCRSFVTTYPLAFFPFFPASAFHPSLLIKCGRWWTVVAVGPSFFSVCLRASPSMAPPDDWSRDYRVVAMVASSAGRLF